MEARKLKQALTNSVTGHKPTDEEVAGVVIEVVDMIVSIANSLERIAVALETK